jgi:PadR family transcriptional regulator, regulatory protein PadR
MDVLDNWVTQLRKGILELAILNALDERERYAYELVKGLVDVPGLGLTEGTIYPLLSRLRNQGWVTTRLEESNAGPARKYYALTREGRKAAELMNQYLDEIVKGCRAQRLRGGRR